MNQSRSHETDALVVENLTTDIATQRGPIRPVNDVSFRVRRGEAVALVGESGSGKTMTALTVMQLLPPQASVVGGKALVNGTDFVGSSAGRIRRARGREIGMVFQDPLTFLNPLMTVGAQIAESVRLHHGGTRAGIRAETLTALERVQIPQPARVIKAYPHELSGGMRQRVLIAIALACRPTILIADEPTTALDVTVQAEIMTLLAELRRELDAALLLITHDLGLVAEYCDRVYLMYAGSIVEEANVFAFFRDPLHPYGEALLENSLSIEQATDEFVPIPGQPPSFAALPAGCPFHPRCRYTMDVCRSTAPPRTTTDDGRFVSCWLRNAQ